MDDCAAERKVKSTPGYPLDIKHSICPYSPSSSSYESDQGMDIVKTEMDNDDDLQIIKVIMSRNTSQPDLERPGFPAYRDLCRSDFENAYRRRHGRNPPKEVEGIDEKPFSPAVASFNKKSKDRPYDPESPTGSPISDTASQLYYSRSSSVDESSSQENLELNGERSNTEPNQNRQISPKGQNCVNNTNEVMQTDPSRNSESHCIDNCQPENSTLTTNANDKNSEATTTEAATRGLCPVMYDYAHGEAHDNQKEIEISEITLPPETPPPRPIPPEQALSNFNQNYNPSWDYNNFSNSWGNNFVTPPYGPWYGMQPPLPWMGGRGAMFPYFRYPFYQQPYDYNVGQYFAPQNYSYRPYCYPQPPPPPPALPVPPPPLHVPPPPLPLFPPPVPLPLTSPSKDHDTNGSNSTSIPASASAVFPQNHPNSDSSDTNNNNNTGIAGKTGESESATPSQIDAPQTNFVDPRLEAKTSNSIYHDLGPKRQRLQCDTISTVGAQSSTSCDSTVISNPITSVEPNTSHGNSASAPQSSSSVGTDGNPSTAISAQSLDQEQVVNDSVQNKSGVPHSGSGVLQGESESGEKSVSTDAPAAPVQVPVVKAKEYKDPDVKKEDISQPGDYPYAETTRYVRQGHRRLFDTLYKTDDSGNGRTEYVCIVGSCIENTKNYPEIIKHINNEHLDSKTNGTNVIYYPIQNPTAGAGSKKVPKFACNFLGCQKKFECMSSATSHITSYHLDKRNYCTVKYCTTKMLYRDQKPYHNFKFHGIKKDEAE